MVKALIVAREQAAIDRMVALIRAEGADAAGTTSDQEAVSQLESGAVGGLVIGAAFRSRPGSTSSRWPQAMGSR